MRMKERDLLKSEISELQHILDEIPTDDVINRLSLESRLKVVQEQLQEVEKRPEFKTVTFVFMGEDVERDEIGVYPDFASKVTLALSNALVALIAANKGKFFKQVEDIPKEEKRKVLMTEATVGEFGFVVEFTIRESVHLRVFEDILEQAFGDDDEVFSDLIDNVDPLTLARIREFYSVLLESGAYFTCQSSDSRRIVCPDIDAVKHAVYRLRPDNIIVDEAKFVGTITGVLPASRDFEFCPDTKQEDKSYIVRGKIDRAVAGIERLYRDKGGQKVGITLRSRTVGKGKPRYRLMSETDIYPSPP